MPLPEVLCIDVYARVMIISDSRAMGYANSVVRCGRRM